MAPPHTTRHADPRGNIVAGRDEFAKMASKAAEFYRYESRFSPNLQVPLSILGMEIVGDPNLPREISCVRVLNERKQRFEGTEKIVIIAGS